MEIIWNEFYPCRNHGARNFRLTSIVATDCGEMVMGENVENKRETIKVSPAFIVESLLRGELTIKQ